MRVSRAVILTTWLVGVLFLLWLTFQAALMARASVALEGADQLTVLVAKAPWWAVFVGLLLVLSLLAWAAIENAIRGAWVPVAYAVGVAALCGVLFWFGVVRVAAGVFTSLQ